MGTEHCGLASAVLLDQHPLWLETLKGLMASVDVSVVGESTDPAVALELVAKEQPDLFLLGIDEPEGLDESDCVREARAIRPGIAVIVLSSRRDSGAINRSLEAGAAAYALKTSSREDLISIVRQALDRTVYLFTQPVEPRTALGALRPLSRPLTGREIDVLKLVAEGLSNAEIGRRLWLSEPTVKLHLSRIYQKLQVTNRTSASRWAHLQGLLQDESVKAPADGSSDPRAPARGRSHAPA